MNFAKARENAGLTVAEVAKRLNVTMSAVCQWESGKTFPEARRLSQLADVYGVTVDDLLRKEERNEE